MTERKKYLVAIASVELIGSARSNSPDLCGGVFLQCPSVFPSIPVLSVCMPVTVR